LNKKILITGSNGFISQKLFNYLKNKNQSIFCTSRDKNDAFYFDLKNDSNSKHSIPKFDILIHLAYFKGKSFIDEKKYNINGSKNIFLLAKKYKAKIIYISSQSANSESYSNYGKIKYELEDIASNFDASIIRPGLIYEKNANMGIFGKIEKIVKNLPLIVVPDGLNKKINLCKTETLLKNINNIIDNENYNDNKIINVSENESYNLVDLVNYISQIHNKKIKIILVNYKIILKFLIFLEAFNLKLSLSSDSLKSLIR